MALPVFHPGGLELTEKMAEKLGLSASSSVLDVGCGTGATLEFLRERFGCRRIAGVDLSPTTAAAAAKNLPQAEILAADAADLPFPDGSFDAVIMECVLSLTADPAAVLREARRVLKPGGRIAVSTLAEAGGAKPGMFPTELLPGYFEDAGFSAVCAEDHSSCLIQLLADAIFRCGSLEAYAEEAAKELGSTVCCGDLRGRRLSYFAVTATAQ